MCSLKMVFKTHPPFTDPTKEYKDRKELFCDSDSVDFSKINEQNPILHTDIFDWKDKLLQKISQNDYRLTTNEAAHHRETYSAKSKTILQIPSAKKDNHEA